MIDSLCEASFIQKAESSLYDVNSLVLPIPLNEFSIFLVAPQH